jgi:hypothetical protein
MFRFSGSALPWDRTARVDLRRWRFAPGAIKTSHVRLLREHNEALRIGTATVKPGTSRLWIEGRTRYPVRIGMGISIGVVDVVWDGLVVVSAVMEEVSVVRVPAYPDCMINAMYEEVRSWPLTPART